MALTDEEVQAAIAEHGNKTAAAEALGIPAPTFIRWTNHGVPTGTKRKEPTTTNGDALTIDKLLKKHHPVERFLATLEQLPRGEFKADTEMQNLCEMSNQAWARLKRNERSQAYKVRLPDGTYVWGRKQDAALLRQKLVEV